MSAEARGIGHLYEEPTTADVRDAPPNLPRLPRNFRRHLEVIASELPAKTTRQFVARYWVLGPILLSVSIRMPEAIYDENSTKGLREIMCHRISYLAYYSARPPFIWGELTACVQARSSNMEQVNLQANVIECDWAGSSQSRRCGP